jgi:hypothetical protein
MYDNTYVFDLETYKEKDNWFEPYACGFAPLKTLVKNNFNRKDVCIYSGESCAIDMLKTIDRITKKNKINITDKKGKKI